MGAKTGIEWTESTWTPIRALNRKTNKLGWHCVHVSEGCRNCYAEGLNKRVGTGEDFKPGALSVHGNIEMTLDMKMLYQPIRWAHGREIFVCSMTDLFADFVETRWIDAIFNIMANCPQHIFQILTKRIDRAREYLARRLAILPNVHIGTSVENQDAANDRMDHLLACKAAVLWVSAEPLLGPLVMTKWLGRPRKLDWLVVGCESGPAARDMQLHWAGDILHQCKVWDVPFFMKQMKIDGRLVKKIEEFPAGLQVREHVGHYDRS